MTKSVKILLISLSAVIVLVGGGVGTYFAIKSNDDQQVESSAPPENSAPQQIGLQLSDVEESFASYTETELTDYFNYLNELYSANIPIETTDTEKSKIEKVFDFYKMHSDLESKALDEIRDFRSLHSTRSTYMQKDVVEDLKSKLAVDLVTPDDLAVFMESEEILLADGDDSTIDGLIQKVLEHFSDILKEKTSKYQLWQNFEVEKKLLRYAKDLRDDINDIDDIKALAIEDLYQLNYDCWMKDFEDIVDVFKIINLFNPEKLVFLLLLLNDQENLNFVVNFDPTANIENIKLLMNDYYKKTDIIFRDFDQQMIYFNSYFTTMQTFVAKNLPSTLTTQLQDKFNSVTEITPFIAGEKPPSIMEGVSILSSASLADIITTIISEWNNNLRFWTAAPYLFGNFEEISELLDYAIETNTQVNSIDDLQNLSPSELYQLHYDAWSNYYSQKISNYNPST